MTRDSLGNTHTYISLELADPAAALDVAKAIAKTISGSVTIADENGEIIGKVCGDAADRLTAAMCDMTTRDDQDLIDQVRTTISGLGKAAN